ncbi:MAG: hypothetical protein R6V19_02180 [Armatimonadota bacterium]
MDCASYVCEGYGIFSNHADSCLRELTEQYRDEHEQMGAGWCML